jgi:hypothetical protein
VTAWQKLLDAIARARIENGNPSSREIARRIGGVSHTTVNDLLRGHRLTSWKQVAAVLVALGIPAGDEHAIGHFRRLHAEADLEVNGPTVISRAHTLRPAVALADVHAELVAIRELLEPRHEVQCPECGATIRARMADRP